MLKLMPMRRKTRRLQLPNNELNKNQQVTLRLRVQNESLYIYYSNMILITHY
jgi:hypothetical protein